MARTVKRLTKEAELRLTDALGEVAQLVNDGSSPDDAIYKVASDLELPAGHVNLMVQTFNIGRSEAQRHSGHDLFEKAAEFDLADPVKILERLYPSEVKTAGQVTRETAVSPEYARRPDWANNKDKQTKLAASVLQPMETRAGVKVSAPPPFPEDPQLVVKRAYDQALWLKREVENRRCEATEANDRLMAGLTKLADYFCVAGRQPFPLVRDNAARLFGKKAELLMEMISSRNKVLVKQAVTKGQLPDPVIWTNEPYSLIRACLTQAETLLEKQAAFEAAQKAAEAKTEELLRPFFPARPNQAPAPRGVLGSSELATGTKAAGIADMATGYGLASLGKATSLMPGPRTPESAEASAMSALQNPAQESKIRNMQTSSMLTDLMANDDVIGGYHPDDVLKHFNEISQIAPRASNNSGLVRAVLRKRLEGGKNAIDPFDIDLMLGIENKIKERDDPSYGSKHAEDKGVLGERSVLA